MERLIGLLVLGVVVMLESDDNENLPVELHHPRCIRRCRRSGQIVSRRRQ